MLWTWLVVIAMADQVPTQPRNVRRAGYDDDVRLKLVEDDLDGYDSELSKLTEQLQRMGKLFIGILCSLVVASVLMAINVSLLIGGGGP